ncbi:hypothetical protein [Enterobacter asburiae]|uniref:hypothetical protein n=1 Tax=Enterobacter asburiae TaxID=61645 RepID=UPI003D6DF349
MILVGLAIDQIAQSGLSSLSVIYYSAQLFRESNPQPLRILDRRLQSLIKDGRISYTTGKGWLKCGGTV